VDFEDKQAEIDTIRNDLAEVNICLDNAESCETGNDFDANIKDAIEAIDRMREVLRELLSKEPS